MNHGRQVPSPNGPLIRVRIAGPTATLGLVLLFLFATLLVLGALGVAAAVSSGVLERRPVALLGAAVLLGLAAFFVYVLLRDVRKFTCVEVLPGGVWRLRNALGVPVERLAPGPQRSVHGAHRDGFLLVGAARAIHEAWLVIESGDRVRRSWSASPATIESALEQLR
jgi:hypothetical protein